VRGEGFMLGLMCKVPNMDVVNAGYDQLVLTVPGGDNVVRLLPSLLLTEAEIAEALARLDAAATALEGPSHA
jgi:acetylornithine/N-succinyldiaminopimelate aminotransferase